MFLLREMGFSDYHRVDVMHRHASAELRDVFIEHDLNNDEGRRVLSLAPLSIGFFIFFLGISLSTIVFILELLLAARRRGRRKTIRQVLVDIKTKRDIWQREVSKKEIKKQKIISIFRQLNGKKIPF